METSQRETSYRRVPDEPELDLYTIPSHSSWFSWDEIHETEKLALKEFFDGSSISRTPRIYKEYRDFIINKYREEPSSRLTFTEIRKSLVGDVNLLHKVFIFLETWGLINFGATSDDNDLTEVEDGESSIIKIEEGVPNGIRVGATPNSVKPISAPPAVEDGAIVNGSGFKLPPLTSYSDVFSDLLKQKILACGNCGQHCGSRYHQCAKDGYLICENCFNDGNYGEQRLSEDFELKTNEFVEDGSNTGAVWTEAETLLLLESVLKHGDDWELVAQNVQTKTKLDCILKLVELPFGDSLLCSEAQRNEVSGSTNNLTSEKEITDAPTNNQEIAGSEDQGTKDINEDKDEENQGPPKRQCTAYVQDTSSSLMKQVALISSMVGPHIMGAAATASVTALCDENLYPKEIFDDQDFFVPNGLCSAASTTANHEIERILNNEDSVAKERPPQSGDVMAEDKGDIPLILRVRAAIATALGAAAARSKLLADQEEREMEYLLAIMIETQMKKMHRKIKHFEDLELIMETECPVIEELEDKLLMERVDEIVNISCALKGRYQTAPANIKRCLKLSMTDGVQRVFGMEYRPIKDLEVLSPAGLKVVICNVSVRRGLLMLVPEAFEVLGGLVEELEAARKRLVDEVNKPPRGRRTRTGEVPPLASRATRAAWPSDNVQEPAHPSRRVDTEPSRSDQGACMFHGRNEAFTAPVGDAFTTPVSRTNANSESSSNFVSTVEEIHSHSVPSGRASTEPIIVSNSVEDTNVVNLVDDTNTANSEDDTNTFNSVEDTIMVDIEHPLILSGDREIPFTYLASLSAKWAAVKEKSASVRGKIKCFLTGVKGFQFKQRATYELHVYVDDGSLISEVLIDHEVVEKAIGRSPMDVTDALDSSDVKVVSVMKETMRQFQIFLVNFEGTMLVEMNRTSSLPVVLEMAEGCLESDARLLLRRLACSNAVPTDEHARVIDVSP